MFYYWDFKIRILLKITIPLLNVFKNQYNVLSKSSITGIYYISIQV